MDNSSPPPLDGREALLRHVPLVEHIARCMVSRKPPSVHLDDLVQAGMIGLMEAAKRYEPARGVAFSVYAGVRIRGAMVDELRKSDPLSRGARQLLRSRDAAIERLTQRKLKPPSDSDVASELGMSLADYRRKLAREAHGGLVEVASDEGPDTSDDEVVAGDPCAAMVDPSGDPSELLQLRQRYEGMALAIEALGSRQRVVLEKRYLDGMSLRNIGLELGVSESRVCQLLSRTTAQLRGMLAS